MDMVVDLGDGWAADVSAEQDRLGRVVIRSVRFRPTTTEIPGQGVTTSVIRRLRTGDVSATLNANLDAVLRGKATLGLAAWATSTAPAPPR